MSIQVNLTFGGDFEGNERHSEVAQEIMDAVQAVIDRTPDLDYKPTASRHDRRTANEDKQPDGSYKNQWGYQYSKGMQLVYHIKKPAEPTNMQPSDGGN